MSPQEIFDTVCAHLRGMKGPSLDEYGNCAYRGVGGAKCAAGVLIPDDVYSPEMEGFAFSELLEIELGKTLLDWFEENSYLIHMLQAAHDDC